MKKIILSAIICLIVLVVNGQNEMSEATAQDILKMLPDKVKDKDAKKEKDKVTSAKGFLGVALHRDYGDDEQSVRVDVINYSPSLISVNSFLNDSAAKDPNQYLVTVIDGYKTLVQTVYKENGRADYEALIPMSATLLAVRSTGYTRNELVEIVSTFSVSKMAKKVEKQ